MEGRAQDCKPNLASRDYASAWITSDNIHLIKGKHMAKPQVEGGKEHSIHHETKQVTGPKGEKLHSSHGWCEETMNIYAMT